jgi:hypothetical protein
VAGVAQLHGDGEIEPGRASAQARNAHGLAPPSSGFAVQSLPHPVTCFKYEIS